MGKRFVMFTDQPGWCFESTGHALMRYHDTEHSWEMCNAVPFTMSAHVLDRCTLARYGGLPLFRWFSAQHLLPTGRRCVPTIASFMDIDQHLESILLKADRIRAFIINDLRFEERMCASFDGPVLYSPDRTDHKVFYPMPELRPKDGPLRVGWAGSEASWPGVKNVDAIEEACHQAGMHFVRQARERDGKLSPAEMARWYNKLDIYVAANIERSCTPVPSLEAAACGTAVYTTRCGELWHLLEDFDRTTIIEDGHVEPIARALNRALVLGRSKLRDRASAFLEEHRDAITWEGGEARRITLALAKLG